MRDQPDTLEISIHALREEGDFINVIDRDGEDEFLSTPSARRATNCPMLHPQNL